MTGNLFYDRCPADKKQYEWSGGNIANIFETHRPKECKRAKRFVKDINKLPAPEQDAIYELLILNTCKSRAKLIKDSKVAEWLMKVYKRWMRYNDLERDFIEQLIGR